MQTNVLGCSSVDEAATFFGMCLQRGLPQITAPTVEEQMISPDPSKSLQSALRSSPSVTGTPFKGARGAISRRASVEAGDASSKQQQQSSSVPPMKRCDSPQIGSAAKSRQRHAPGQQSGSGSVGGAVEGKERGGGQWAGGGWGTAYEGAVPPGLYTYKSMNKLQVGGDLFVCLRV